MLYASRIRGSTLEEKLESLAEVFRERQIPFDVERQNDLPLLQARACPYPELAEQDRSVCSMERMMFSELVGENLRLSNCRLDGHTCCTFEPAGRATGVDAGVNRRVHAATGDQPAWTPGLSTENQID